MLPIELEFIILEYWAQLEWSECYKMVLRELRHVFILVHIGQNVETIV